MMHGQTKIKLVFCSKSRPCKGRNFCPFSVKSSYLNLYFNNGLRSGFCGLEVSVLAFATQVRGFKPGRSRRIFRAKKSSARLPFGGKVKPSVPCRKFTARKRTRKWRGSRHFRQNSRWFLAHRSLASFQTLGTPCGGSCNVQITGPPSWGFDVLLANGTL